MATIPLINIVAAIHLSFIMLFLGMYMVEAVMELMSYFNRRDAALRHSIIRLHFWVDLLVEIPVIIGVFATGVTMAFLVEKITMLHAIKIGLVVMFVLVAVFCPLNVIDRYRLMKKNADEETLVRKSRIIIYTAGFSLSIFFTGALLIGFWLAYHRILASIYS